jgi:hypothetical protein
MPQIPILQPQSMVPTASANVSEPGADQFAHALGSTIGHLGSFFEQRKAIADRQAHDEANLHTINAEGRVQLQAQQVLTDTASTGNYAGLTDRLGTLFDQWSKTEDASAPQLAKPKVAQSIAHLRNAYLLHASQIENAGRNKQLEDDFSSGLENDKRLVWADPTQFTNAAARRQAVLEVLNIPDERKQVLGKQAREGLAFEAANGMTERNPDAVLTKLGFTPGKWQPGMPVPDTAAAIDAVKADPVFSNLGPDKLEAVLHRALTLSSSRDAASRAAMEKAQKDAEKEVQDLQKFVLTGELASPEYQKQVYAKTAAFPELDTAARELFKQSTSGAAFGSQTLPQQQQTLLQADARMNTAGSNPDEQTVIAQARQIHQAQTEAYKEDPWAAATRFHRLPPAPEMTFTDATAVPQLVAQRLPLIGAVEARAGYAVSPLHPGEAAQFADTLKHLQPQQRGEVLGQVGAMLNVQQGAALAEQLDKTDKPLALALKLQLDRTTAGRTVSTLVLRGAQGLADKTIKRDDTALSGWRADIASIVRGTLGDDKAESDAIDAAYYVRAAMDQEGINAPGYSLKASAENAVRLVLGQPMERGGAKTVLPRGMTQDQFDDRLRSYTPDKLAQQAPARTVFVRGQPRTLQQLSSSLPTMGMKLDPRTGRYTPVSNGAFVTLDAAGTQPLQLEVR